MKRKDWNMTYTIRWSENFLVCRTFLHSLRQEPPWIRLQCNRFFSPTLPVLVYSFFTFSSSLLLSSSYLHNSVSDPFFSKPLYEPWRQIAFRVRAAATISEPVFMWMRFATSTSCVPLSPYSNLNSHRSIKNVWWLMYQLHFEVFSTPVLIGFDSVSAYNILVLLHISSNSPQFQ